MNRLSNVGEYKECATSEGMAAGESEAKVRQLFQEAADVAPCIVFIGTALLTCLTSGQSQIYQEAFKPGHLTLWTEGVCPDLSMENGNADEIDAIAAKRESAQREMERRIVAQMLTCLDDLAEQPSAAPLPDGAPLQNKHVVVIGAPLKHYCNTLSSHLPSLAGKVQLVRVTVGVS